MGIDHLAHSSGGVGEAVEARKLQSQAVAAKVESFSRQKVKSKMWQQAAICALLISSVRGVSIAKESSASVAVQFGQELLLDCDFIFDKEEEEELVVKWFFNASTTPFFQWVPALDVGPQVIMREAPGEIDVNYSVEGENSFTKHRTLRIAEASLAHIGAYTCQVSSFTHEVSSTVDVAVFVPPSSLRVWLLVKGRCSQSLQRTARACSPPL